MYIFMHYYGDNNYFIKSNKKTTKQQQLYRILLMFIIFLCTCSFEPVDFVVDNVKSIFTIPSSEDNLIPDLTSGYRNLGSENLLPSFPSAVTDAQSEQISKKIQIKDKLQNTILEKNNFFTFGDNFVDALTPSREKFFNMLNLDNVVMLDGGNNMEYLPLEPETENIPLLNDLPSAPLYNDTWYVNSMGEIQVPGLDDVLPHSVGEPLTEDNYDIQSKIPYIDKLMSNKISPDDTFDQEIIDIIP